MEEVEEDVQVVAGEHWAGVGVLVSAREGAWLLHPNKAAQKVGRGQTHLQQTNYNFVAKSAGIYQRKFNLNYRLKNLFV